MAEISAKDVQRLRQSAGVGMMDAKKALTESDGDLDKAMEILRERGLSKMAKRADREAAEGTIGSYLHEQDGRTKSAVIVHLASETDFVAKSDEFRDVAKDIAMHIAWFKPRYITRDEVPETELEDEKELIAKQAANEGKPEQVIPKIVEGRMSKFYEENVLLDQTFVNTEKFDGTVEAMIQQLATKMGENIHVRSFSRLAVGE